MIPYFLLLGLPILFWGIGSRYRFTLNKRQLVKSHTIPIDFFMLFYLLLLSFRGLWCGVDTIRYRTAFEMYGRLTVGQIIQGYEYELGFKLLMNLVYELFGNYQFFLAISSLICVYPLWLFYRRESEHQILTIALFVGMAPFIMYFSGIKQSIAMSMGILAWYAAKQRRLLRFLVIVFIAMQIHNSGFVLLFLYPLYRARITKRWVFLVVPLICVVFVYREPIFQFLLTMLWEEYSVTEETGATTILILLILFAVYAYIIPDEKKLEQDIIAMRNILLLSVVIQIFAMLHPLSMRMNYYFLLFIPILLPKIAARRKPCFNQVAQASVLVMTGYFLYYFLEKVVKDTDPLQIFPYIPFWENLY